MEFSRYFVSLGECTVMDRNNKTFKIFIAWVKIHYFFKRIVYQLNIAAAVFNIIFIIRYLALFEFFLISMEVMNANFIFHLLYKLILKIWVLIWFYFLVSLKIKFKGFHYRGKKRRLNVGVINLFFLFIPCLWTLR